MKTPCAAMCLCPHYWQEFVFIAGLANFSVTGLVLPSHFCHLRHGFPVFLSYLDECSGYLVRMTAIVVDHCVVFLLNWTIQFMKELYLLPSVVQSLWWCTGWFIDLMESFTWVILHSTKMLEQISSYEMKVQLCVKFVFLKIYILLII